MTKLTYPVLVDPMTNPQPMALFNAYVEMRRLALRLAILIDAEEETRRWKKARPLYSGEAIIAAYQDIKSGALTVESYDEQFHCFSVTARRTKKWMRAVKQAEGDIRMATVRGVGRIGYCIADWDNGCLTKLQRKQLQTKGALLPDREEDTRP